MTYYIQIYTKLNSRKRLQIIILILAFYTGARLVMVEWERQVAGNSVLPPTVVDLHYHREVEEMVASIHVIKSTGTFGFASLKSKLQIPRMQYK